MNTDTRFLFESFYGENEELFRSGPLLIAGVKSSREVAVSKEVHAAGHQVVIAEPWPVNAKIAEQFHSHAEVLGCEVQKVQDLERFKSFVWLQGPEHVELSIAKGFFEKIQKTVDLIVLEMHHGIHVQGADGGNHHEIHVTHWLPQDFDDMDPGWVVHSSHEGLPGNEVGEVRHLLAIWKSVQRRQQ